MNTIERRLTILASLVGVLIGLSASGVQATPTLKMDFVTHAAFFSNETKQQKTLDPQVFVRDAAAAEATGPQGIKHVAGVRPALIDQDAGSSALSAADAKPLGFDLQTWLGAKGMVTISDMGGEVHLEATFTGLKPNGVYSLFENHFDQTPVGFTPMDGTGQTNSFKASASGTAVITMKLPHFPTHANAVLLVYHSDNQTHGLERGRIGFDAHHQLIARPQ